MIKNHIEIRNETEFELNLEELVKCVNYTLDNMGVSKTVECSITIVDEMEMTRLNDEWMDSNKPTDVLSFPMDELRPYSEPPKNSILGDIVLCPAYANKTAVKMKHSLRDELLLLTIHSVLHLLGYDHKEPLDKETMFSLQKKLLLSFIAGANITIDLDKVWNR